MERWRKMTGVGRDSREQVETQQRVWERTKVSSYSICAVVCSVTVCLCIRVCTCWCACIHVFICSGLQACSPADMDLLQVICLCGIKVKLSELKAKTWCAGGGEIVGLLVLCELDGGGDGGGSVRPAALLWRVTSSPAPWHCGSSTKPCRGQREKTTHERGGGTGCECGCRCEWACMTERGRKTGRQEEKARERESSEIWKGGKKRTTGLSGRTGKRTHRRSTRGAVRQETQTQLQTNRLNNARETW